jgi:hypothetical protein
VNTLEGGSRLANYHEIWGCPFSFVSAAIPTRLKKVKKKLSMSANSSPLHKINLTVLFILGRPPTRPS